MSGHDGRSFNFGACVDLYPVEKKHTHEGLTVRSSVERQLLFDAASIKSIHPVVVRTL